MEVAPGSDSSPPLDSQDRSAQQTSINPTALSNTSGLMSWDEILSSGDTPASHGASSLSERVRLPRLQEAPQEATQFELHSTTPSVSQQAPPALSRPDHPTEPHRASSFEPESAPPSMSQQEPSTRPRAEVLLQPRRLRHRVDCGLRFQPYRTPPIPRNLDEVQIPDGTELAVMEQIHGKPGGMSESLFHKFRRGHGVPPDIAFNMRVQSMIGVYPSGLIYVGYGRLAAIPAQRHRSFGARRPALYWARILTLNQAPYREHIEHFLSKTPGPFRCRNCQYDREHGIVMRRGRTLELDIVEGVVLSR
jgi:hypothetical protein